MATYITTVDPNGGADYSSLANWEAGEQSAYVSGDIARADCRQTGTAKDDSVDLGGWTSGVKAEIVGNSAYSPYRIDVTTNYKNGVLLGTGAPETTIEWLDIKARPSLGAVGGIRHLTVALPLTVRRVVVHDCLGHGIYLGVGAVCTLENVVSFANGGSGVYVSYNQGPPTVYINFGTFCKNGEAGINRVSGTVTATNCYSGGNTSAGYNGTITKNTCGSSDATGSAGLQNIAHSTSSGAKFVNVTAGSEDYHVQAGSALIGVGTTIALTTDFDGDTRATPPGLGADEYVAGGGGTVYTETLTSLVTSLAASADRQSYLEAADVLIASGAQAGAVHDMLETLLSLGQGQGEAADGQGYADQVATTGESQGASSSAQDYADAAQTTAQESAGAGAAQDYRDEAATVIVEEAIASEQLLGAGPAETLLSVATSAASVSAAQAFVETVTGIAAGSGSLAEAAGMVERVGTVASSVSAVQEQQLFLENLAIVALSGASLAEIGAYIEQVATAAAGTGSLTDVLVGQFAGRYLFVDLAARRSFQDLAARRSFQDLATPRSFQDLATPRRRTLQ